MVIGSATGTTAVQSVHAAQPLSRSMDPRFQARNHAVQGPEVAAEVSQSKEKAWRQHIEALSSRYREEGERDTAPRLIS